MSLGESVADLSGVDTRVLGELTHGVDTLIALGSADMLLKTAVLKFQLEQAADKAVYAAQATNAERLPHLQRVLQRMSDLALTTARYMRQRTEAHTAAAAAPQQRQQQQHHVTRHACCARGVEGAHASKHDAGCVRSDDEDDDEHATTAATASAAATRSQSVMLHSSSSVEDFVEGTDAWLESGALLLHTALDVLANVLLAHARLRGALQHYLLQHHVLDYIDEALAVTRESELAYFAEGYRTAHLRLVANLVAGHAACALAVTRHARLLPMLLASTQLDADNPGAAEWATFALRNLCSATPEAQGALRALTARIVTDVHMRASADTSLHREALAAWQQHASQQRRRMCALARRTSEDREMAWRHKAQQQWCGLRDTLRMRRAVYEAQLVDAYAAVGCAITNTSGNGDDDGDDNKEEAAAVLADVHGNARALRGLLYAVHPRRDGDGNEESGDIDKCAHKHNAVRMHVQRLRLAVARRQARLASLRDMLQMHCDATARTTADVTVRDDKYSTTSFAYTSHILQACFVRTKCAFDDVQRCYIDDKANDVQAVAKVRALRAAFDSAVAAEQARALQRLACLARHNDAHDDASKATTADTAASPPQPRAAMMAYARLLLYAIRSHHGGDAVSTDDAAVTCELLKRTLCNALPRSARHVAYDAVSAVLQQYHDRQRVRALVADYTHASAQLEAVFATAVRTHLDEARCRAQQDGALAQQQEAAARRARILAQQRAVHAQQQSRANAELQLQHEEEARAAAAQQARHARALQRRLRALAEYEKRKAEARAAERELDELRAREQLAAQALRAEHDATRVAYRRSEYEAHVQAQRMRAAEVARLRAEKQAALQRFFAEVEARLHVTTDTQRIQRATASRLSAQAALRLHSGSDDDDDDDAGNKDAGGKGTHKSRHGVATMLCGYSDEEVMRDPRVQLYHALLEAGLHTTRYAGHVIARGACVPPAMRTSVDNTLAVTHTYDV